MRLCERSLDEMCQRNRKSQTENCLHFWPNYEYHLIKALSPPPPPSTTAWCPNVGRGIVSCCRRTCNVLYFRIQPNKRKTFGIKRKSQKTDEQQLQGPMSQRNKQCKWQKTNKWNEYAYFIVNGWLLTQYTQFTCAFQFKRFIRLFFDVWMRVRVCEWLYVHARYIPWIFIKTDYTILLNL